VALDARLIINPNSDLRGVNIEAFGKLARRRALPGRKMERVKSVSRRHTKYFE
jgi:hypothetical protein